MPLPHPHSLECPEEQAVGLPSVLSFPPTVVDKLSYQISGYRCDAVCVVGELADVAVDIIYSVWSHSKHNTTNFRDQKWWMYGIHGKYLDCKEHDV